MIKTLLGKNKKISRFQLYARAYGRYARAPAIAESIRGQVTRKDME